MAASRLASERPGRSSGKPATPPQSSDRRPRTYVSEPPTRPGTSVRRARPTRSASGSRRGRLLRAEALDGAPQALLERGLRLEAEQLAGARHVEVACRLPVRHRGVPDDLALEAGELVDR